MEIIGGKKFVEVPGDQRHELPPLLVHGDAELASIEQMFHLAEAVVEQEELVSSPLDSFAAERDAERRRMDLALNLVEQYRGLLTHWQWGDSILEWIRQCETTFLHTAALRSLLRHDIWPHAGRSSFVTLLEDKHVYAGNIDVEKAVGLRLTFRQPPSIEHFSDQFLFFLNESVAHSAYSAWQQLNPPPVSALPPERFHFEVHVM